MSDTAPPKVYRLATPYEYPGRDNPRQSEYVKRVQANIPTKPYCDFFEGTLSGVHGRQLYILSTFIHKLITHAYANGLSKSYDPDNESRVAEFLEHLNFDDTSALHRTIAEQAEYITSLERQLTRGTGGKKASVARGTTSKPARRTVRSDGGRGNSHGNEANQNAAGLPANAGSTPP